MLTPPTTGLDLPALVMVVRLLIIWCVDGKCKEVAAASVWMAKIVTNDLSCQSCK